MVSSIHGEAAMLYRISLLAIVYSAVIAAAACAEEKPLLTLSKQKAPAREAEIGGQLVRFPSYDYGLIVLHNCLNEPIPLAWNINEDQNFTPVVRNAAGQVVSNGQPFGFARAPRLDFEKHTVPPGKEFAVEARMLFETVPDKHRKPGSYFIRVQFALGESLWESNEIRVELDR
jgi:hypothetical protein